MSRADRYIEALSNRDHAMIMLLAIIAAVAVLLALYHRPKDRAPLRLPSWLWPALLVAGVAVRVAAIASGDDLWYDEAFTAAVVGVPLPRAWAAIMADVHPPGWYAITAVFTGVLGRSELALRLPAFLCSLASLGLFAWWLRRIELPELAGVLALGCMALASVQVRFAAEARCYAGLELAALAILAGATLNRRWLFIAGMIAAPWLQHLGWLYVGAGAVIWLLQRRPWRSLVAPIVAAVPAAVIAAAQLTMSADGGLAPGIWEAGYWIQDRNLGAFLYHGAFQQFFMAGTVAPWLEWPTGVAGVALYAVAIFGGLRRARWSTIVAAFGPGLAVFLLSQWKPLLLARTLIGTDPALYALAGVGIQQLKLKRGALLAGVGALVFLMLAADANQAAGGARGAVQPLFEAARAAGCTEITHAEPSSVVLGLYYAPDIRHQLWGAFDATQQNGAPTRQTETALGMLRGDPGRCMMYSDHVLIPPAYLARLDALIAGRRELYEFINDEFMEIALYE